MHGADAGKPLLKQLIIFTICKSNHEAAALFWMPLAAELAHIRYKLIFEQSIHGDT